MWLKIYRCSKKRENIHFQTNIQCKKQDLRHPRYSDWWDISYSSLPQTRMHSFNIESQTMTVQHDVDLMKTSRWAGFYTNWCFAFGDLHWYCSILECKKEYIMCFSICVCFFSSLPISYNITTTLFQIVCYLFSAYQLM